MTMIIQKNTAKKKRPLQAAFVLLINFSCYQYTPEVQKLSMHDPLPQSEGSEQAQFASYGITKQFG